MSDPRMTVDEAGEMERAFLDHAHRRWHQGRAADHEWTTCKGATSIRREVDAAWASIPPDYALVARAALAAHPPEAALRNRLIVTSAAVLRDWLPEVGSTDRTNIAAALADASLAALASPADPAGLEDVIVNAIRRRGWPVSDEGVRSFAEEIAALAAPPPEAGLAVEALVKEIARALTLLGIEGNQPNASYARYIADYLIGYADPEEAPNDRA